MPTNGSNNQMAIVRDAQGRWVKGFPGGPGRPLGSRNRLAEDFLGDMHAAWREHGPEVINRLIAERPEVFLLAMLKLAQVYRVEPNQFVQPQTKEELMRELEEYVGPEGRKAVDKFFSQMMQGAFERQVEQQRRAEAAGEVGARHGEIEPVAVVGLRVS